MNEFNKTPPPTSLGFAKPYVYEKGACYVNLFKTEVRPVVRATLGLEIDVNDLYVALEDPSIRSEFVFALSWWTMPGKDLVIMLHIDKIMHLDPRPKIRGREAISDLQKHLHNIFKDRGVKQFRVGGSQAPYGDLTLRNLELNQGSLPLQNDVFRSLNETVAMTEDWTVCRCQIHRTPFLDFATAPTRATQEEAVGKHPSIRAAASGENKYCHADPDTRIKDSELASVLLGPWPPVRNRGYMTKSLIPSVKSCMSANPAPFEDFGLGYCLAELIHPRLRWRVARLLGPNAYLSDWLSVIAFAGVPTKQKYVIDKVGENYWHLRKDGNKQVKDGETFNMLLKHSTFSPKSRFGFTAGMLMPLPVLTLRDISACHRKMKKPRKKTVEASTFVKETFPVTFGRYQSLGEVTFGASEPVPKNGSRIERTKSPRVKKITAEKWQMRCLQRKMYLLSLKRTNGLCFKSIKGRLRPFVHGKSVSRPFPETFGAASIEIVERFGRVSGPVSFEKFATESAWLYNYRECPRAGFRLSYEDGWMSFSKSNGSGVDITVDGSTIFHLGERNPRSPDTPEPMSPGWRRYEMHTRRASSISIASSFTAENQTRIDAIDRIAKDEALTSEEIRRRVAVEDDYDWTDATPTVIFGLAMVYKATYGCPPCRRYEIRLSRFMNNFDCKETPVTDDSRPGLYWYLDSKEWYHCGPKPSLTRERFWKAIALSSLKKSQEQGVVIGKTAISLAQTAIPCVPPGFAHQLIGFRVAADCEGHRIFSRGLDFTREDDSSQSFLTVRQYKKFWDNKGRKMVFTMKGLAKIFYRKTQQEKWRYAIARSLGLTLPTAYAHFAKILNDHSVPDVVFQEMRTKVSGIKTKVIEKPIYVEVPIKVDQSDTSQFKTASLGVVPPPAPPLPAEKPVNTSSIKEVDGDAYLAIEGTEGKSRRAEFRSHFANDWWLRISERAMKYMNQDLVMDTGKSRSYSESALICDPKVRFNLYAHKRSKSLPISNGPAWRDVLNQQVLAFRPASNRRSALGRNDPRDEIERRLGYNKGRVLPSVDEHVDARDSTHADIELNPGPSEKNDTLKIRHPSPVDYDRAQGMVARQRRKANRHRKMQSASDIVYGRQHLGFAPSANPLKMDQSPVDNLVITQPTPVEGQDLQDLFDLPRGSEDQDIETNPGPSEERESRKDKHLTSTNLRARSRSAMDRVRKVMGLTVESTMEDVRELLNLDKDYAVSNYHASKGTWLGDCYDTHHVIGSLPTGRPWKLYKPCNTDRMMYLNTAQRTLDSIFDYSSTPYDLTKTGQLMKIINRYLEMTPIPEGFDFRSLAAIACIVKTKLKCPEDGRGYAVEFNPDNFQIILHYSISPKEDLKNKIVWCIGDANCLHGGVPDKADIWTEAGCLAVKMYYRLTPSFQSKIEAIACNETGFAEEQKSVARGEPPEDLRFIAYLYLRLYYLIVSFKLLLLDGLWPEPQDTDIDDDSPNEQTLLVGEYGTHGDIVPVHYLVNVARHFGVKVHEKVYARMDHNDLEALREGDFLRFLPKQLYMASTGDLGYKKILLPHVEVEPHLGHSYCLNPSSRYVEDTKFVDDWAKVSLINWLPAQLATLTTKVVSHTWRIGALKDCQLPRSADGQRILRKVDNTAKYPEGWVAGSAQESVIPHEIRRRCPRIPNGDHNLLFRDYEVVHCHGGAGTVQTIIAAGARPVIHDPTLDRNYHTIPNRKDFKQPTVGPFMGWLVWSGFKTNASMIVKILWLLMYANSVKLQILYYVVYSTMKIYVITNYIRNHWGLFMILFFTMPTLFWRVLYNTKSLKSIFQTVLYGVWNFPLFCLLESRFSFVVALWSLNKVAQNLLQDYANAIDRKTELVFEPVERQGVKFPFPFGHWAIKDTTEGAIYEGYFTTSSESLGADFGFRKVLRETKQGSKTFPAPFNIYAVQKMLKTEMPRPYGPNHNCVTMVTRLIGRRSVTWTIFMSAICGFVYLALSPPEVLRRLSEFFFPGCPLNETPFYRGLGFAAGIEHIPFEPEEDAVTAATQYLEGVPDESTLDLDYSKPESLEGLYNELATLQVAFMNTGCKSLTTEDFEEATVRAFDNEMEKVQIPKEALIKLEPLPPYVKNTWAQIVDNIHHAISFCSQQSLVASFIAWLRVLGNNVYEFVMPILEMLSYIANVAYLQSETLFHNLFVRVCEFLDHVWGLEASKRVKTAWGLTGLYRTGMLGAKARLAANIAYNEFVGRSDFQSDYNRLVKEGKEYAKKYHAIGRSKMGGPQRRPVGYAKPLMAHEEAKLLGFEKDEYTTEKVYQDRIDSYIKSGVSQGADGVFLAEKHPELIAKSQHRYEPKYPELSSDERQFAKEIAQAMFEQYPEVFKDADIVSPASVHAYVKKKYSPGTPFIKPGGFKSRQAIFDAGFDKVLQRRAVDKMTKGDYECQFYHAFVKSQVVDIRKCLPFEEGGKNKDVRTVVSQDLLSYYGDQVVQIERNKRINWDTYGAGIGMPLNQSMEVIYNRMADHMKTRGGRYIIADATAFDSFCKPFLFEVNACLWELGFKDHPSGNGKNIASVVRASYDARQSAWILGITEPEYDCLTLGVPQKQIRAKLSSIAGSNLVPLDELIDHTLFNNLNRADKIRYVKNIKAPHGKTIMTWDPELVPNKSNWMGNYVLGETEDSASVEQYQNFKYGPNDYKSLAADVKAVAASDYRLLSNVHPKNRGGSTGGSDTSNVNTHAFKAGVIAAWCLTTGRRPKEFYQYNDIANTSDDTIWQTGGQFGLNTVKDIEAFRHHCASFGIHLEIETTKDINKVEYLSKFVRVPTREDSEALKAWRSNKIGTIARANKLSGYHAEYDTKDFKNPRFVVVQNPSAILLRRSAFRYYQSNATKWRFVSVERGSGHALNTAFCPDLYEQFALEWCDDVNEIFKRFHIHRRYQLKNGKFGLQECVQVDSRASQQRLSPRQKALLMWLKGNMFPSYYRVIDIHMNVAKIDPELHAKFLRKLEKGWRGWEQIIREGVDGLFALTNSIPDEWSKKFQPSVEMLYAEQPFYTRNCINEKFVYLKMLEESPEEDISFSEFSKRIQESPYAGTCDIYHFWERLQSKEYKEELMQEEVFKIQGLVYIITAFYMMTSTVEWFIMASPFGILYKLMLWSFVGLNKVYGVLNTMYWHSTGKSSREISRIMPRDPYLVSKQACAFLVDLLPQTLGLLMTPVILLNLLLPPCLECIGKTWFKGGEVKNDITHNNQQANPWVSYADQYIDDLRTSPTKRLYVAAKTSTGKSTYFISALWAARNRKRVRKFWLVEPRRVLRDNTVIPFGVKSQVLKKGVQRSNTVDVYILTYGHLQSRLQDVDVENDILLFDEFHEEQGEMILGLDTVKAPIFLLSATPSDVPSLKGSKFVAPDIDRRHPITIHTVPDGTSAVDMYMQARNRYPEEVKRCLIIVPTLSMVTAVVNSLNYLGAGRVTELTKRQRVVAEDGVIVATQIVEAGLDIKPPPDVVIDLGLSNKPNKGIYSKPVWTDPSQDLQRTGRCGRLKPGIVFKPESAGTGKPAIVYPSANLFMHKSVAEHFKMPQLTPVRFGINTHLPFMRLNTNKLNSKQVQKAVTFIHAMALQGIRQSEWEAFYTRKMQGKSLGEDYDWLDRVHDFVDWKHVPLIDWKYALYWVYTPNTVGYGIAGQEKWKLPLTARDGRWVEVEHSPTEKIHYVELTQNELDSRSNKMMKALNNLKSSFLRNARSQGAEHFARAAETIESDLFTL